MAIVIQGLSICPICKKTLNSIDENILFPPFVQNTLDSFYLFNDIGVHKNCLDKHPLGALAKSYLEKIIEKTRPQNLKCDISGNLISSKDDFLFIDLLCSNKNEELSNFNFTIIDKKNIAKWAEKEHFLKVASNFLQEGKWKSFSSFNYLQYLINEICKY
jgi:hypothetical protein